jgi:hypothetical protein
MPTEYDKFDRHIDKWGIVGLEWLWLYVELQKMKVDMSL